MQQYQIRHYLKSVILLCFFSGLIAFPPPVNAQFVTLARKIKSKHTVQSDVATMIIDAKPYQVYQAVIDTLTSNSRFIINQINDAKRSVEFSTGTSTVSMKIDSLAVGEAQITATAPYAENAKKTASDMAVKAIIAVCQKLGVKYTVEKE